MQSVFDVAGSGTPPMLTLYVPVIFKLRFAVAMVLVSVGENVVMGKRSVVTGCSKELGEVVSYQTPGVKVPSVVELR